MLIVAPSNDLSEGFNGILVEIPLKVVILGIGVIKGLFFSLESGIFKLVLQFYCI